MDLNTLAARIVGEATAEEPDADFQEDEQECRW